MLFKVPIHILSCISRTVKVLPGSAIAVLAFILCANNLKAAPGTNTNGNAPVISGISVSALTSASAIINWSTNVPANSQVIYGTTTTYGFSTLVDSILVSSHSQYIAGLNAGTLYHYKVISEDINGSTTVSADNTFTATNLPSSIGSLNNHNVLADAGGKIIPWTTPNPADGYVNVMAQAWNYLLNNVPNDPATGKPAYYSQSYLNPNTQGLAGWPHNPAGLYSMLTESALKYYGYSGNADIVQVAEDVALWHLDHGMTTATDNWPGVPYASGDAGSSNYMGANLGNSTGQGDGNGYLEPDKIGELGRAWLQLYKYDGNTRFRDAAIQVGKVLSNKVRTGTMSQSPWPFRVNAHTGNIREDYCGDVIAPIILLDGLIASGLGDTAAYRVARNTAWNWMMTYPMQNNIWTQYFEDSPIESPYSDNINQYDAMMAARYLLEHPELDINWETHVRGLISWVETKFGQTSFGATAIKEQKDFAFIMGSHTSRYASVNALLYERTGDLIAKEKAYRSFNWATYMAKSNGVDIDGPDVNNEWFTDGYADYIRHFMTGLGAVPEWAPFNQTHLLRSSSIVKAISYGTNNVNYTTYDGDATDVLHINFNPVSVTADGIALPQASDLSQPGWTLDVATKTLRIYHTNATQISISAVAGNSICPGENTSFTLPKPGNNYVYQWQIDSTGTGFVDLSDDAIHTGANADTLLLTTPPTSYYGFKYRCVASKNGTIVSGTPLALKFAVTWHGTANTSWENNANWSCNHLPDAFTDVIIPATLTNNPVIGNDITVHSITLSPGTVLTVNPGVRLDIKGK
jgi:hypothetical protein